MIPHKCPVCNGSGFQSRPSWVAGDQNTWAGTGSNLNPCHACQSKGIVWEPEEKNNA